MSLTTPFSGPHTHAPRSVGKVMLTVMFALFPATAFGLYLFGWPALILFAITIATAVISEAICLWIAGKPVKLFLMDGSAVLTAWLLAMTLPPWAPWWIGVVGAAFAIFIGKHVFGGIGQNIFNPAMLARVVLLISFPLEMTTWTNPIPLSAAGAPGFLESLQIIFRGYAIDTMTGASMLGHVKTELGQGLGLTHILADPYNASAMATGFIHGSMGETSAYLLIAGGLLLMAMRIISWHIPLAMLGSVFVLASLFHFIDPNHYPDATFHLLSGGLILGAFFIATDPVTSPNSASGKVLFGAGCGSLDYIIRTWGGYPEGIAFAVMLMNAVTPLIDHYLRPRVYGYKRKNVPLNYEKEMTQ